MTKTVLVLSLLALSVSAGEVDDLRQDIAALRFLNDLDLNRAQARALLPIAEAGAQLRREYDRDRDRLMVKFHSALVKFREEDLRDQGLSKEAIAAAGGLSHTLKELGNRVAAELAPLERKAAEMLSLQQRRGAFKQVDNTHPLDLLRRMRHSDFDELRDKLARQLARDRVKAGLVPDTQARKERLRIRSLLYQVKHWDQGEYMARREELLKSLVPGYERNRIACAIRDIYRARYGKAGPMAEHLFTERMLPVLAERAGVPAPKLPPLPHSGFSLPGDIDRIRAEVASLKADINLLNLMNGLHLTRDQVHEIMHGAERCAAALPKRDSVDDRTALPALREIYRALRRNEPVPQGAVSKLQSPLVKRGHGYANARRREFLEERERTVERLMGVLTPEQGEVLRTYKACLVPPQNLRDPVRAGQAKDFSAMERYVDRLRKLPLDENATQAADRVLKEIESHEGRFPQKERDCRLWLLLGVAYEAQQLDDAAYVARRAELAGRLQPLYRLETLKDRLMAIEGDATVIRRKTAAFLLDARIVPLAQDRFVRLTKPEKLTKPGDLPKADICEDGKCGKP